MPNHPISLADEAPANLDTEQDTGAPGPSGHPDPRSNLADASASG
ncbi:hypothetical protein [Ralstonia solanacearum]|nr:hypothetical protein [Ralstonia solanacearum]MDC6180427.1 hypothetical protein [Ralstonia solanacearum]MDC6213084.1 hypothetical protein [Ralstonia solanacearum]MDC6242002.1 hypothetical protein [Ralstonia solanacearum]MDD7803695.1 hypothetical protein [Ralstonia solanacearum]